MKPGDDFIVEDGICHHGLKVGPDPGPYEAIETFVSGNLDFISDREKESFLITWNRKVFLKTNLQDAILDNQMPDSFTYFLVYEPGKPLVLEDSF
jgi:hypothetical protein